MKDETYLDGSVKRGDKGNQVKRVQEWLCIHGFSLVIDGDFGPATESRVRKFQSSNGLHLTGSVNEEMWEKLITPLRAILATITPHKGETLSSLVVRYAQQHLAQHPREVGGQNMGPWVRMYMGGNEGSEYPWCAGFVSFVILQACQSLGVSQPIISSWGCDALATDAIKKGRLVGRDCVEPGSIFLIRKSSGDWSHTGIVTAVELEHYHSIEGNTNDDGIPEGYEVCSRTRGYSRVDFILLD